MEAGLQTGLKGILANVAMRTGGTAGTAEMGGRGHGAPEFTLPSPNKRRPCLPGGPEAPVDRPVHVGILVSMSPPAVSLAALEIAARRVIRLTEPGAETEGRTRGRGEEAVPRPERGSPRFHARSPGPETRYALASGRRLAT